MNNKTMKSKSNNEIDEAFRKIDEQFDKISRANAEELGYAQLKSIHEKFPFSQNVMTVLSTFDDVEQITISS